MAAKRVVQAAYILPKTKDFLRKEADKAGRTPTRVASEFLDQIAEERTKKGRKA